jgi:hypothetical protein
VRRCLWQHRNASNHVKTVSVQTTTQSVNALVSGLDQLKVELRESRDLPSNDRFIQIMTVTSTYIVWKQDVLTVT